ncbi:MAG: ATP-dependent zinc metalloprotease FtsH [Sphaerochaetaceae bacterium]|nr:ATP-dependent zinc metalloprotease FtsH [Sphaerochaetaceae bacterium]
MKDNNVLKDSEFWGEGNGPQKNSSGGDNRPKNDNPRPPRLWIIPVVIAIVVLFFYMSGIKTIFQAQTTSYTDFLQSVELKNVKQVEINDSQTVNYVLNNGENKVTRIPYFDSTLIDRLLANNVAVIGTPRKVNVLELIINLLPLLFLIYLMFMFMRQAKAMNGKNMLNDFGQSHAREYKANGKDSVNFSDVAGQEEAKTELQEIVEFLKNPKKFTALGARIPKGVLLVGPPGTGKTLIARAVAGESGVSFFHTSGSDFVEMFVGMGASRVRDLFAQARKKAPCIIFIDELDAVGRSRGAGLGGGHDEREQTLNQMLVEMDGFETDKGIIVMAATNRPDVLDSALLRPGRFDRQVSVELPDIQEREAILKIHFKKVKTEENLDIKRIARATPGCSGADLANLVNEAALLAARASKPFVTMIDVEEARDKIILGVAKKTRVMTPEDKTKTAYHEAGHTLLHYYVKGVDPLHKVTIIPHGSAGGVTMSLPENDIYYVTKTQNLAWIKLCMGGYVAEELVYGETSTGPSQDIKMAMSRANRMVTEWGMSPLGFVDYSNDDAPLFLGRDIAQHKNFSDDTARKIDAEVRNILDECIKDVRQILTEHRDQLDLLTKTLVEKETLDDKEIRELLGFEAKEDNASLID